MFILFPFLHFNPMLRTVIHRYNEFTDTIFGEFFLTEI